jgi:uncharacterized protein (DUF1778 family)
MKAETARLEARVPNFIKEKLATAAALQGVTQTDFLIVAVNTMAGKFIAEHNVIQLCLEDQEALAAALLNDDPDVSHLERLARAVSEHNEKVADL